MGRQPGVPACRAMASAPKINPAAMSPATIGMPMPTGATNTASRKKATQTPPMAAKQIEVTVRTAYEATVVAEKEQGTWNKRQVLRAAIPARPTDTQSD